MAIKKHQIAKGEWIEIYNIDNSDIAFLKEHFPTFHPTNLEDASEPVVFPKLDIYKEYFFLSDSIPINIKQGERAENFEVHMFILPHSLITITKEPADVFIDEHHSHNEIAGVSLPDDAHLLAYRFMDKLYSLSDDVIANVTAAVQKIDNHILEVHSTWLIREIAILQRNVIYFLTSINASMPLFMELESYAKKHTSAVKEYWGDLEDKLLGQKELLEDYEKALTVLSKAHEMVVNRRTNKIVTVLTMFSAIFLPLNLIAGIYGMNIQGLPFAQSPYAFLLICSTMLVGGIILYGYLTSRRWL